jgi:phosphoribosylformylglycinamidine synthase subunit PurQ / glutaminase
MKFGVIVFPGSNCDDDLVYVLSEVMGQQAIKLWHKDHDLKGCDGVLVPGGFSYGDYLRSGAIARFSPIMNEVSSFAKKGGFVFGICNGFQILTEAGLLPGALLHNLSQKYICKNVYITPVNMQTILTQGLEPGNALSIPMAHGEGRFYAPDHILQSIEAEGQVVFRYTDAEGNAKAEFNPNGSLNNIAGVCNNNRNVFGMMPHPERAAIPFLGNEDGKLIFQSILEHLLTTA